MAYRFGVLSSYDVASDLLRWRSDEGDHSHRALCGLWFLPRLQRCFGPLESVDWTLYDAFCRLPYVPRKQSACCFQRAEVFPRGTESAHGLIAHDLSNSTERRGLLTDRGCNVSIAPRTGLRRVDDGSLLPCVSSSGRYRRGLPRIRH